MKILFLCMTEFQLLTALNAKCHLFPDDEADIIVGNYHGEEELLARRIRATTLFRAVCAVNSGVEEKTLHAYLRGISEENRQVSLKEALINTYKYIKGKVGGVIYGPKSYLNVSINGYNNLKWQEYDAVFAYGKRPVTEYMISLLKRINPKCKIIQMDEGVASYIYENVGGTACAEMCLLYEPKAMIFAKPAIKLPKLSRCDSKFIQLVNFIFDVPKTQFDDFSSAVIFFDQGVEECMPAYLRKKNVLTKIIFYNAYKKHLKEHLEYQQRKKNTEDLLARFKGKKIYIKPHPRSSRTTLDYYLGLNENIKILPHNIPWEVMALNSNMDNTLLVTDTSSAVILYAAVFNEKDNNKSIILYKAFQRKESDMLDPFVNNMADLYKDTVLVPESLEEFKEIVDL